MMYAITGLFALVEAGLLALVTRLWDPAEHSRRLLTIGAVAGSLSIVLLVGPLLILWLGDALFGRLLSVGDGSALGIGLVLVPVGLVCSVLGIVLHFGARLRARGRA
ncbi:hypothetical protein [Natronorubrum aibiense]|uniref:hypothetical protein n=1 Tax=Natronorubrum aibiense TaxID=348826 RepID=UPI001D03AD68|nr:hypothetical protein [Natronorubrum aibiense]